MLLIADTVKMKSNVDALHFIHVKQCVHIYLIAPADRDAFSRFYARTPEFVNPELLMPHIRGLDSLFR